MAPPCRRPFELILLALAFLLALAGVGRAQGVAPLPGRTLFEKSLKPPEPQAQVQAALPPSELAGESMEIMVALKMRNFEELQARVGRGEIIPRAEMEERYYPLAAEYDALVAWLKREGLEVTLTDPLRMGITVTASVEKLQKAFVMQVGRVSSEGKSFISAITPPSLPSAVARPVLGINGLQPQFRPKTRANPTKLISSNPPYLPSEMLRAYGGAGLNLTGAGQKIGIVIDTFARNSDLTAFWTAAGVPQTTANIENVQVVSGTLPAPSGEESLDVQWASGVASGAKVRVYATRDLAFVSIDQAYQRILNDLPSQPGLRQVSLSFGLGETYAALSQIQTDAQYFASMAANGVSVFVASGDGGSSPGPGGHDHTGPTQTSTPASDPNVTAVGGTNLTLNPDGSVRRETVWFDGGGAPSVVFSRPVWQVGPGVPGGSTRLVPDVASAADPNTGGLVYLDGEAQQIGGTSWSAPMWAGFCALINQARESAGLGPLGPLNPRIYPLIGTANFRDITSGTNGGFSATANYDLCTGVGVPNLGGLVQTLARAGGANQPNLTFSRPADWSDSVVLSSVTGSNTDAASFRTTDSLYVDYAPLNNGTAPVTTPWHGKIYVDDVLVFDDSFKNNLASGASDTTVLDRQIGPFAVGIHTLKVVLDADAAITEFIEGDNLFQKTFIVSENGVPNLSFFRPSGWSEEVVVSTVAGTNTDSATITNGTPLFIDYAPQNNGPAPVGAAWHAKIFVNNVLVLDESIPAGLGPFTFDNTRHDRQIGGLPVGTHTIKVVLDSEGAVGESNEDDNTFQKTITVIEGAFPNLTFYQPSGWSDRVVISTVPGTNTDSPAYRPGDILYIDLAPWNRGQATVDVPWRARIFVDDIPRLDLPFPAGLGPNFYYSGVLDNAIGSLAVGTHVIRVVLDANGQVAESDEGDNVVQRTITVTAAAPPNLTLTQPSGWSDRLVLSTVTGTTTDAANISNSDNVYLDFAPFNNATGSIPNFWTAKVYVNGLEHHNRTLTGPAPNSSSPQLDVNLGILPTGSHVVRVVLDANDTVGETNENDNAFERTITVSGSFTSLTPGVTVGGLSGAKDSERFFKVSVPAGVSVLNVRTSSGTGDVDLYVRAGDLPTTSAYDERGFSVGHENVTILNPAAGDYFILLRGFDRFEAVSLVATFTSSFTITANASPPAAGNVVGAGTFNLGTPRTVTAIPAAGFAFLNWTEKGEEVSLTTTYGFTVATDRTLVANFAALGNLSSEAPIDGLADPAGGRRLYKITVPAGATSLKLATSDGAGDVDLFARRSAPPTTETFDLSSSSSSSAESITIGNPIPGDWYVLLDAFSAYTGVTLRATIGGRAVISAIPEPLAGGLVTGSGEFSVGSTATLVATPASGYVFVGFVENGVTVSPSQTYSFTVADTRALVARFAFNTAPATITAVPSPVVGGSVSGAGTYAQGEAVTLTATPGTGYKFVGFTENGTVVSTSATYAFTAAASRALVANFSLDNGALSLTRNTPLSGLRGAKGSTILYRLNVPPAARNLTFRTSGGTGDVDLHAKFGGVPTPPKSDATSLGRGTAELIRVAFPRAGDWYLLLKATAAYRGVTLVGSFDNPAGRAVTLQLSASPETGGGVEGGGTYAAGAPVTVVATPRAGHVFSGWMERGVLLSTATSLKLTLTADRELVAGFAPVEPFTRYSGSYNGLIGADTSPASQSGFIQVTVSARRAVSGYVVQQGRRRAFRGVFDAATSRFENQPSLRTGALPMRLLAEPGTPGTITGSLQMGRTSVPLLALRGGFGARAAGSYTVLLPGDAASAQNSRFPRGIGFGTMTVTRSGRARLTATLGDGSPFIAAATIAADGRLPLYASLHQGRGVVAGWTKFEDIAGISDLTGALHWSKPRRSGGLYPTGFDGHLNLVGSRYRRPSAAAPLLRLPLGTATLTLDGATAADITARLSLAGGTRLLVAPPNPATINVTVNPADGRLSGTFRPPGARRPLTFQGVVLQKQSTGGGFFIGGAKTGSLEINPDGTQ